MGVPERTGFPLWEPGALESLNIHANGVGFKLERNGEYLLFTLSGFLTLSSHDSLIGVDFVLYTKSLIFFFKLR